MGPLNFLIHHVNLKVQVKKINKFMIIKLLSFLFSFSFTIPLPFESFNDNTYYQALKISRCQPPRCGNQFRAADSQGSLPRHTVSHKTRKRKEPQSGERERYLSESAEASEQLAVLGRRPQQGSTASPDYSKCAAVRRQAIKGAASSFLSGRSFRLPQRTLGLNFFFQRTDFSTKLTVKGRFVSLPHDTRLLHYLRRGSNQFCGTLVVQHCRGLHAQNN